jgi:hypothetical protein
LIQNLILHLAQRLSPFLLKPVFQENLSDVLLHLLHQYMSEVGLMLLKERDKYPSPHRTIIAIALFAPEVNSALGATAFTISVETGVS